MVGPSQTHVGWMTAFRFAIPTLLLGSSSLKYRGTAHWTTKNSADPLWPTTSENTVVTVVQARFQFLYPFCSGPSSSASKMRSLSIFLSTNYFFQWDGLRVCLFDRPPLFYINKPVLGHSNEFPLLMIFFITNKNPKTSTSSRLWWGSWTKVVPELKSPVHNGRNDVLGSHGSHR